MKKLVFVDIETTGLDPIDHDIIEIGLIEEDGKECSWWIELFPAELSVATSQALTINHYYERKKNSGSYESKDRLHVVIRATREEREKFARKFATLTDGCVLAGFNVKFDQQFLELWLRRSGAAPTWNYHVLDVATYAAGVAAGVGYYVPPPYGSRSTAELLQMPPQDETEQHTALGDARYSLAMWKRAYDIARGAIHITDKETNESAPQAGQPE